MSYSYSQGSSGGGGGGGGGSTSSGSSSGSSVSSSTPFAIQTPQSQLEQQIAQYALGLSQQQYQWGLGEYAKTSAMTDQAVQNFLAASTQDQALAAQTQQQYEAVTAPEITQQANMAAQYTSPSRVGINMGMAESQQQQATNSALASAKQNLQSYGIKPDSGMYDELQTAAKTAGGAAAAGAGTQAEYATEATGRQLLGSSIATGQQLPGQAINASNAGVLANQAAENSTLSNANTGVNLTDTGPNQSLQTAMSMKYPGIGNASSSASSNSSRQSGSSYQNPTNPSYSQNTSYSVGGAKGGAIPGDFSSAMNDGTQGGGVPQSASPSNGVNVDDVPANLNAEEFVIPRDVARWKGEEFFHKEIAKSRAMRAKAAATVGPTLGPARPVNQQPTFTSEAYGGGGI